jgi:hypothetical protein
VIKLHFHADCDGIVSAFFVSKELDRLHVPYSLHPSLGSYADFRGRNNIALDLSNVKGGKWNLSIDHHVSDRAPLFYANPRNAGFEWPVSFITYALFGDAAESWVAAIGVLGDWCSDKVPARFWDVVRSHHPELVPEVDNKTLIRDKLGDMVLMLESVISLERSGGALYALEALKSAKSWKHLLEGKGKAGKLKKAKAEVLGEVGRIFGSEIVTPAYMLLRFSSPHRIKSLVAGRAKDEYPDRMVVIAQDEGNKVRLSFRNADGLDKLVKELTEGIGEGGGHPRASGGWVQSDKWDVFEKRLKRLNHK